MHISNVDDLPSPNDPVYMASTGDAPTNWDCEWELYRYRGNIVLRRAAVESVDRTKMTMPRNLSHLRDISSSANFAEYPEIALKDCTSPLGVLAILTVPA